MTDEKNTEAQQMPLEPLTQAERETLSSELLHALDEIDTVEAKKAAAVGKFNDKLHGLRDDVAEIKKRLLEDEAAHGGG